MENLTENGIEITKECTKCHEIKEYSDFFNTTRTPDGKSYWCKDCHAEYYKIYGKANRRKNPRTQSYEYMIENRWKSINQRTINGLWSKTTDYNPQFKSYLDKKITLDMTFNEFSIWMYSVKDLYMEIAKTDKPCIDRIDDTKGYQIDNIQLISRTANFEKKFGKPIKRMSEDVLKAKKIYNHTRYLKGKKNKIKE